MQITRVNIMSRYNVARLRAEGRLATPEQRQERDVMAVWRAWCACGEEARAEFMSRAGLVDLDSAARIEAAERAAEESIASHHR
jgi:hypothetical protein